MLDETDTAILALERNWWKHAGSKEQAILNLGLNTTSYYRRLNSLIDRPEALAADPVLVRRLQRLRATRLRQRGHLVAS